MNKHLQIVAALLASLCFALAQDESRPAPAAPPPTPAETAPAAPAPLPAPTAPPAFDPTTGLPVPVDPKTSRPRAQQIDPNTGLPNTPGQKLSIDPSTGLRVAPTPPNANPLANGAFEEEGNLNLEAAMNSYQSVISRFDGERPEAANAIFRLGECYRKLGRTEEAKVQYARILREFPDQVELTRLSQKYLSEPVRGQPRFQQRLQAIVKRAPEKQATAEEKRFLKQQIDLYQARIAELEKQVIPGNLAEGQEPPLKKEIFDLKLQLIHLKEQLAAMEKPLPTPRSAPTAADSGGTSGESGAANGTHYNPGATGSISVRNVDTPSAASSTDHEKALIQEQLKLIQRKLEKLKESRKQNLVSDDAIDDVKMQLLSLQRDLAAWEAKNTLREVAPPAGEGNVVERRDTNGRN